MKTVEEIKAAIEAAVPGAKVDIVTNPAPSAEHSLLLGHPTALAVARFLRDDADLALDYLSNVSGVDWPDKEIVEKVKVKLEGMVKSILDEEFKANPAKGACFSCGFRSICDYVEQN